MTSSSATTTLTRARLPVREARQPRRAYLDTYAQRRQPASNRRTETMPPARQGVPAAAAPLVQPNPVPAATQPTAPPPQAALVAVAPVSTVRYTPTSTPAAPPPAASYIDQLVQRPAVAPPAASAAQPDTHTPLPAPDAQTEARLTANLQALYEDPLTKQFSDSQDSASTAHIRTIVASALTCGVLAVGMFTFLSRVDSQPVVAQPIGSPVIEVEAPASQPQPNAAPAANQGASAPLPADPSHPVRLVASSIGLNAAVEGLGTTPEGLIAVPRSYGLVGWYNKASVPGQAGPAVLVGHYTGGYGGVFDKLKDLKDGDLLTTTNGRGESFTYRVTKKAEYERDKVPMQDLFKKSSNSRLEIITCAGNWQANNYDKRLVVSAELVQ